ncbi:MAG: hypothetical protein MUD12_15190 [Spirochaetes bacterium]|jgi:hypothetical protein|nr:hypothetical protein [Spirochaetota bacterium]
MRKIIWAPVMAVFLSLSCYDGASDFSRVLLLTGNMPADTTRLHVGVFLLFVSPETLITEADFTPSTAIPMIIPSGTLVTFSIWAEGLNGGRTEILTHAGVSLPVILNGQALTPVALELANITGSPLGPFADSRTFIVSWNAIPGATGYELQEYNANAGLWETAYSGPFNSFNPGHQPGSLRARAYSTVFSLSTAWEYLNW